MPVTCDIHLYAGTEIGVIHVELPPGLENDPEGIRDRLDRAMLAFKTTFEQHTPPPCEERPQP